MSKSKEYLIELIYRKLKNNNIRKIELEKKEFTQFIKFLINSNQN